MDEHKSEAKALYEHSLDSFKSRAQTFLEQLSLQPFHQVLIDRELSDIQAGMIITALDDDPVLHTASLERYKEFLSYIRKENVSVPKNKKEIISLINLYIEKCLSSYLLNEVQPTPVNKQGLKNSYTTTHLFKKAEDSEQLWNKLNSYLQEHQLIKGEIFNGKTEWLHRHNGSGQYSLKALIEILNTWKYNNDKFFDSNLNVDMINSFIIEYFTIDDKPITKKMLGAYTKKKNWLEDFKSDLESDLAVGLS